MSALSAGACTATLYVMVIVQRGGGRACATPHPHQPGLIFPSWWDVSRNRQSPLCVYLLCGTIPRVFPSLLFCQPVTCTQKVVGFKYVCCLFWYFIVHTFIPSHSYSTSIRRHSPRFLSISSSLVSSVGKTSVADNRARACHTASRRTPNWATPHAPCTELRCTQQSYAEPYWATPHPLSYAAPLLTYAAPYWATKWNTFIR